MNVILVDSHWSAYETEVSSLKWNDCKINCCQWLLSMNVYQLLFCFVGISSFFLVLFLQLPCELTASTLCRPIAIVVHCDFHTSLYAKLKNIQEIWIVWCNWYTCSTISVKNYFLCSIIWWTNWSFNHNFCFCICEKKNCPYHVLTECNIKYSE